MIVRGGIWCVCEHRCAECNNNSEGRAAGGARVVITGHSLFPISVS